MSIFNTGPSTFKLATTGGNSSTTLPVKSTRLWEFKEFTSPHIEQAQMAFVKEYIEVFIAFWLRQFMRTREIGANCCPMLFTRIISRHTQPRLSRHSI